MENRRIYPRVTTDWPLYLAENGNKKKIGYIKNISLSGVKINLLDNSFDLEDYTFNLKLRNNQLNPSEIVINGLKKWTQEEQNDVWIGLEIKNIARTKKHDLVKFLSRNTNLDVEVIIMKDEK